MNYNTPSVELQNEYRAKRYDLLAKSALIAKKITGHRVKDCMRMTVGQVSVGFNKNIGRAGYRGVVVCGSVWDCPVCSARISIKRREELSIACEEWKNRGGVIIMVTFTMQHDLSHSLDGLSRVCTDAIRFVKSGAPYKRKKEKYLIKGAVTNTEITYSLVNGWHYHKHMLLFLEKGRENYDDFENWLYERYNRYLVKHGYYSKKGIGVKITHNKDYEEYITKWGLQHEITSQNKKGSGLTPFELLENEELLTKWLEYSSTMIGKRQLTWSAGLREYLGMGQEVDDAELLENDDNEDYEVYIYIDRDEWLYILDHNMRSLVLEYAETGKKRFQEWYIKTIRNKVRYRNTS